MLLMNEDREVLKFDFEDMYMEVLNNQYLPFALKDYLATSDYSTKESIKNSSHQLYVLKDYLANRTLSLSKENAKQILNALALPQSSKIDEKLKIVYACQGLSMTDNIWIKEEDDKRTFSEVNLRNNHLKDAAVPISLLGFNISSTNDILAPDISTGGMFAKTWYRGETGIELWKTDKTTDGINTKAEVQASKLLDNTNVNHVHYELFQLDGKYVCKCKNLASDDISLVDGYELSDYCVHHNTDLLSYMETYYLKDMSKMCVIDYILGNTDRHLGNIQFFVDNKTNEITDIAPLIDHNQSLIADIFKTDIKDIRYELTNMTLFESACKYYNYSGLQIDVDKFPKKCVERLAEIKTQIALIPQNKRTSSESLSFKPQILK